MTRRSAVGSVAFILVACGGQSETAPPPMFAAPPPALSSATPPPPPAPPPPLPRGGGEGGGGMHHPPPPMSTGHVYKLEFALTSKEGATAGPPTSFAITLEENRTGEVMIGKNVALGAPNAAAPNAPVVHARQDVGIKVKAHVRPAGDDLFLDVNLEMSAHEPPSTIRKIVVQANALASPGKATQVVVLDEDKKHYELAVTPTKLR